MTSSADFWARKLGQNNGGGLGYPKRTAGLATAAQPPAPYLPAKAASAASTERCPECSSSDYAKVATAMTARGAMETWRCFDCGYPVKQRFSGMSGVGTPVTGRARQVAGLISNYQPQNTAAGTVSL